MTEATLRVLTLGLIAQYLATAAAASGATITVDGIYNPANDAYTHQFVFPLILDDGTPVGQTELKVGIGANADGQTGGPNDLFVYFEMPLDLKDTTWGDETHDGYSETSNDVENGRIAMNQNTGSEKIAFQWNGNDVEVKLSQRGNANMQVCSDAGNCFGYEMKSDKDGGDAVVGVATSLDYIMNNFPNQQGEFDLWGDDEKDGGDSGSNSPTLKEVNGDDIYETVNPAFADWPFHQSWEIQITGPFLPADLPNLLTESIFFGADFGGDDPKNSNFLLHASPIKAGAKFDVVPSCAPGACGFEPITIPQDSPPQGSPSGVPEPSTFALAALGLLALGFVDWRRRARKWLSSRA